MLLLIWGGLHVAVVLGLVSFVGVWIIRDDIGVAANLLAQASSDAMLMAGQRQLAGSE